MTDKDKQSKRRMDLAHAHGKNYDRPSVFANGYADSFLIGYDQGHADAMAEMSQKDPSNCDTINLAVKALEYLQEDATKKHGTLLSSAARIEIYRALQKLKE